MLNKLALKIHNITGAVCVFLLSVLLISEVMIVLLRYVFGMGFLPLQNLASYSFSTLIVLGIPYALVRSAHVRVDILREHQGAPLKRKVDVFAVLFFLFPLFGLTLYMVMPDIFYSWQILEGSKETGGLPGLFLVKTALPVSCVLMMFQGFVMIFGDNESTESNNQTKKSRQTKPDKEKKQESSK